MKYNGRIFLLIVATIFLFGSLASATIYDSLKINIDGKIVSGAELQVFQCVYNSSPMGGYWFEVQPGQKIKKAYINNVKNGKAGTQAAVLNASCSGVIFLVFDGQNTAINITVDKTTAVHPEPVHNPSEKILSKKLTGLPYSIVINYAPSLKSEKTLKDNPYQSTLKKSVKEPERIVSPDILNK
ncbi:MAG: hypothetical protein NT099_04895 [Candidatus Saganbacteria bacterium]|nr:hypothetical protein [Candidatus Saganbacteria bacterium]